MTDSLITKEKALAAIENAAEAELKRIHGKASVDYVLGYQRCAKKIIDTVEMAWPQERK